jgi:hypothetical protein
MLAEGPARFFRKPYERQSRTRSMLQTPSKDTADVNRVETA